MTATLGNDRSAEFANIPRDTIPADGPRTPTLSSLFRANKWRILTTYLLFNLENLLRLAQPFVLGLAINGLLNGTYFGLMVFVVQHLGHLGISSVRRMYDTRSFTMIYSSLATGLVLSQRETNVDVSRVAARSALSRCYVEFFEEYVPMLIRAAYSVVGALVMLGWYDWTLIPLCVGLTIPAFLLNVAYSRKTLEFSRGLHDQYEQEVGVIRDGEAREIRKHYDMVASWRVRLSDAEALNFSLMELFVLGTLAGALVHYCTGADPEAGDIFAVFRYVLLFIMGLDTVPRIVQQLSTVRDVGFRLQRGKA